VGLVAVIDDERRFDRRARVLTRLAELGGKISGAAVRLDADDTVAGRG